MWKQTHREKLKNQKEFKIYNITESSKTWRQLKTKGYNYWSKHRTNHFIQGLEVVGKTSNGAQNADMGQTCINRIENITLTNLVFSSLKNTTCLLRT
jgi:phenylalanine-4-hydroxylase